MVEWLREGVELRQILINSESSGLFWNFRALQPTLLVLTLPVFILQNHTSQFFTQNILIMSRIVHTNVSIQKYTANSIERKKPKEIGPYGCISIINEQPPSSQLNQLMCLILGSTFS